ncbi:hypothetical protein IG631_17692 [Alternaria alternata]|nr:hypothetical protein IG631_17692 [Alternaria alternata]
MEFINRWSPTVKANGPRFRTILEQRKKKKVIVRICPAARFTWMMSSIRLQDCTCARKRLHARRQAEISVPVLAFHVPAKRYGLGHFNVTRKIGAGPCTTELLRHFVSKDQAKDSYGVGWPSHLHTNGWRRPSEKFTL